MRFGLLGCLMLLFSGCVEGNNRMCIELANSYSMEFREVDGKLYMPLWVPISGPEHKKMYHHPVSGVQIDSVEADWVVVEGRTYDIDYDDFDLSTFEAQHPWHVYQVIMRPSDDQNTLRLVSVSKMGEDDFDLKQYCIPANAARIVIHYRPRYPLDDLGAPIVAFAERNEFSP